MKEQGYQYTTDLLVIGCGFSGMWAAMRARDFLGDVLVVDKGPRDWGGLGGLSGGDDELGEDLVQRQGALRHFRHAVRPRAQNDAGAVPEFPGIAQLDCGIESFFLNDIIDKQD